MTTDVGTKLVALDGVLNQVESHLARLRAIEPIDAPEFEAAMREATGHVEALRGYATTLAARAGAAVPSWQDRHGYLAALETLRQAVEHGERRERETLRRAALAEVIENGRIEYRVPVAPGLRRDLGHRGAGRCASARRDLLEPLAGPDDPAARVPWRARPRPRSEGACPSAWRSFDEVPEAPGSPRVRPRSLRGLRPSPWWSHGPRMEEAAPVVIALPSAMPEPTLPEPELSAVDPSPPQPAPPAAPHAPLQAHHCGDARAAGARGGDSPVPAPIADSTPDRTEDAGARPRWAKVLVGAVVRPPVPSLGSVRSRRFARWWHAPTGVERAPWLGAGLAGRRRGLRRRGVRAGAGLPRALDDGRRQPGRRGPHLPGPDDVVTLARLGRRPRTSAPPRTPRGWAVCATPRQRDNRYTESPDTRLQLVSSEALALSHDLMSDEAETFTVFAGFHVTGGCARWWRACCASPRRASRPP
ncbi:MAG: hypothetical protein U0324_46855 [Polyangiales bacterium]